MENLTPSPLSCISPQENGASASFVTPEANYTKDEQHTPQIGLGPNSKLVKVSKRKLFPSTPELTKGTRVTSGDFPKKFCGGDESPVLGSPQARSATPLTERQQLAYLLKATAQPVTSPTSYVVEKFTKLKKREQKKVHSFSHQRLSKRNERGETLLHLAAIKGDCRAVAKLIKSGADIEAADYAGWTALHEACNHGHLNVARTLLKAGANVNAAGLDSDTPLHDAVINDHLEVVRLLVEKGANPSLNNGRGQSPLSIAKSEQVYHLLKEANGHSGKVFRKSLLHSFGSPHVADDFPALSPPRRHSECVSEDHNSSHFPSSQELDIPDIACFKDNRADLSFTSDDAENIINDILEMVEETLADDTSFSDSCPKEESVSQGYPGMKAEECTPKAAEEVPLPVSSPDDSRDKPQEVSKIVQTLVSSTVMESRQNVIPAPLVEDPSAGIKEVSEGEKEKQRAKVKPATRSSTRPSSEETRGSLTTYRRFNIVPNKSWLDELSAVRHDNREIPVSVPGYQNFLMSKKKYLLSRHIPREECFDHLVPDDIPDSMQRVFVKHTKELVDLQRQQQVEQERLDLACEQELVREATYKACSAVNRDQPFSVCFVLQYQQQKKALTATQSGSRDSDSRTVQAKYQVSKREMQQRHKNELDCLNSLHNLEWQWKMRESYFQPKQVQSR